MEIYEESWKWLSKRLLETCKEVITSEERVPYGYLFGCACALQESLALLSKVDHGLEYDRFALLPQVNFKSIVDDDGAVKWRRHEKSVLHGSEFYLNKAQANIAAVLDSISNGWIINILPGPYHETPRFVHWDFFHHPPVARLRIIASIGLIWKESVDNLAGSQVLGSLSGNWDRFGMSSDTDNASFIIKHNVPIVAGYVSNNDFWKTYDIFNKEYGPLEHSFGESGGQTISPLSDTDCLAIVTGRMNAFKHLPEGHSDRRKQAFHYTEWAITARAFRCVNSLLVDMLDNVRKLKDSQKQKGDKK